MLFIIPLSEANLAKFLVPQLIDRLADGQLTDSRVVLALKQRRDSNPGGGRPLATHPIHSAEKFSHQMVNFT